MDERTRLMLFFVEVAMNSFLVEEPLTRSVIGAFFEVYNTLGFGFFENVYVMAMERELLSRGHQVGREVHVPVFYKGDELAKQRIDMVVDGRLIVEIKSTHALHKTAARQLYSYLRATRLEVGLLLHFGPRARFHRLVHRNAAQGKNEPGATSPDSQPDLSASIR